MKYIEQKELEIALGQDQIKLNGFLEAVEKFPIIDEDDDDLRVAATKVSMREFTSLEKYNKSRKAPLDLVPPCAMFEMARAFGYGADKYGRQNWIDERAQCSVYYAAMMRHMLTWFEGEDIDPESGVYHLAHVMANCAILIHMKENNNFDDDRIGNKDLYKK